MPRKYFDLAKAKAGAPVETRSGHPARIISFNMKSEDRRDILALVNFEGEEQINTCYLDGRYDKRFISGSDLVMKTNDSIVRKTPYREKPHELYDKESTFNLEKAKKGAKVMTRCGFPVKIVCYDAHNHAEKPIVALVNYGRIEIPKFYFKNGKEFNIKNYIGFMDLITK